VRLISVDALVRLMQIREEIDDPATEGRIRSLLVPREYTRVDEIIDLVFSTTEELIEDEPPVEKATESDEVPERTRKKPVSFNAAVAGRIARHLDLDLTKQSRITFADATANATVTCSVSKEYADAKGSGYWFAFHPHQLKKLKKAGKGFAAFGCGSPDKIALLPIGFLEPMLAGMNQTRVSNERSYWHIQIHREGRRWVLHRRKEEDWPDITDHMLMTSDRVS
jgi:hypothetical protein